MTSNISKILSDATLDVEAKVEAITKCLYDMPDHGVVEAMKFIFSTDDSTAANYSADYLALLPDSVHEKQRVVEYILDKRNDFLNAVVSLIRDIPEEVADRLAKVCIHNPTLEGVENVIYDLALFFPGCLRKHYKSIVDLDIRKAILAGGPDQWADRLAKKYTKTSDALHLRDLGRFHTEHAVSEMLDLEPDVPQKDKGLLHTCVESSGVFPDNRKASIWGTTFSGRVVERAGSPHAMGSGYLGSVPACAECGTPANRILTLSRGQLHFEVRGDHDPSFFWIRCVHPQDSVVARITSTGAEGILTPTTVGPVSTDIFPGTPSLALESHPNQFGYGTEIVAGFGLHQVGGHPPWIRLDRFPRCPLCGDGMRYLCGIDGGMTPFGRIALEGMLFGFWCESCNVTATLMQDG